MSPIKFVTNRPQLPLLELPDGDAAPAVGGPDHRRVHKLQDRALAERVRDDLGAPPLFQEEALEEIGGADHLAVAVVSEYSAEPVPGTAPNVAR